MIINLNQVEAIEIKFEISIEIAFIRGHSKVLFFEDESAAKSKYDYIWSEISKGNNFIEI